MEEGRKLDGHHRATVEKIFRHPAGHNLQWHDVLSLLKSVPWSPRCTMAGTR
jgi:hypothetical protein